MERKHIIRLLLTATLLFAVILTVILAVASAAEKSLPDRIGAALERGDTQKAERLTARLSDDALRDSFEKRCHLAEADALLENGQYREAAALYASLGHDGGAGYDEALYRLAGQELSEGEYETAARRFEALGGYRDAADRALEAHCAEAESLYTEGRLFDAFLAFYRLGNAGNAASRTLDLAEEICGSRDAEAAYAIARDLSSEELAHRDRLAQVRDSLPRGIIAVGFYHTVALRSDGTVLACGDDSFGQCGVSQWRRVKAVCAGAYHTAALLEDGTVIACGRNEEGQCEVSLWRDIVAVTAADYATFGLKADGTVVACGYNDYYMLRDWNGITSISGGTYALAALRAGGDALISHESARDDSLRELVDIAVTTGCAAGLKADGSVVCPAEDLSAWTDIVALSASPNMILGLGADGSVSARFFHAALGEDFAAPDDVVAFAAGGTHCAFVRRDGSVLVWGSCTRGEGETALWDLF